MADRTDRPEPEDDERAVYVISVAAELAGVHPQTLRIYERKGLRAPPADAGEHAAGTPSATSGAPRGSRT